MAPKRLSRREQTLNWGVAGQPAHLPPPPGDVAVDHILDDLTTFNAVMAKNPALLGHFKQSLICMGKWPQDAHAASSSSSRDQATGDSSGSGERPASSSTGNRVSVGQGSDESANTKENKDSGNSTMTPGPTTGGADSSGSSAAGNAGKKGQGGSTMTPGPTTGGTESSGSSAAGNAWRNQCASDQVKAWLINKDRSEDNDGQSSDSSAKGKDSEKSSSGAVAGSSGCMGDVGTSAGTSSSAQRWEYNEPGDGTPLQEGSDDSEPCRKAADGENSEDSGPRLPQDLAGVGMDCLPQDAFVWVLGQDAPKLTVELQPGDQVCCFDSLGKNIKYVGVTDVRVDDEPVDWVRVELADGTKTVLTKDHPVQLSGKHAPQEVVKAGDIEPQKSRIMVQRVATRAVRVSKVIRVPPGLMNPSGRVAVTVRQPDRNAILVASPGQGGEDGHGREDIHFVAVGSADLMPKPCGILRTRIQPTVPLMFPEEVGRRSSSWPPDPGSRLELSLAAPFLLPLTKNQAGSSRSGQDSSRGSYQDSASETSSGGDTMVLLPWILPKTSPDASHAPRGVSELLQARQSNWPSVGSSGHPDSCRPCAFAHRGRCLAGVWCPNCHGQHRKCNGKLFSVSRPPPRAGDGGEGR